MKSFLLGLLLIGSLSCAMNQDENKGINPSFTEYEKGYIAGTCDGKKLTDSLWEARIQTAYNENHKLKLSLERKDKAYKSMKKFTNNVLLMSNRKQAEKINDLEGILTAAENLCTLHEDDKKYNKRTVKDFVDRIVESSLKKAKESDTQNNV